jgi:transcriptional regulator with XRE-family HTH domain
MDHIGKTIRSIRIRLEKTMVEFATLIGAKQSTVSRYEAGKLKPGRPVLILLLQLAKGGEKAAILQALGVERTVAQDLESRQLIEALRTFESYLESPLRHGKALQAKPDGGSTLVDFVKAAKRIILAYEDVDPSVTAVLNHWYKAGTDPGTREVFRNAAAYLDVELAAQRARKLKRTT